MTTNSHFIIENRTSRSMQLVVEPEAALFFLPAGEQVDVHDGYQKKPARLTLDEPETGDLIVSIWPGDGDVVVRHEGNDVLEIVQAAPQCSAAMQRP